MTVGLTEGEQIRKKWTSEKEVPQHIINRKADKRLDHVTNLYKMAMGDNLTAVRSELLSKTLYCEGFRFLQYLNLNYTYENRLWAFSYNLNYKTAVTLLNDGEEMEPRRFIVKNKGKMAISDAQWVDGGSVCNEKDSIYYLKKLNNSLIIDRIVAMDITNVELIFEPNTRKWKISCRTLIGSTTWILIPPAVHLIKPKPVECVKMLELFELIFHAVSS